MDEVLQRLTGIKLGERKLRRHVASCFPLLRLAHRCGFSCFFGFADDRHVAAHSLSPHAAAAERDVLHRRQKAGRMAQKYIYFTILGGAVRSLAGHSMDISGNSPTLLILSFP